MFEEFLVKLIPWIIPLVLLGSFFVNHAVPTGGNKKDSGKAKASKTKEQGENSSQDTE